MSMQRIKTILELAVYILTPNVLMFLIYEVWRRIQEQSPVFCDPISGACSGGDPGYSELLPFMLIMYALALVTGALIVAVIASYKVAKKTVNSLVK